MDAVWNYLKKSFSAPKPMNAGFALLMLSLGSLVSFIFRYDYKILFPNVSSTSLAGFSFITIVSCLLVFVIPAAVCASNSSDDLTGHYTGIGVLLTSFVSGIPLMLIVDSLHNLMSWLILRLGEKIVFPVYFCYFTPSEPKSAILMFLTKTLIPSVAASIFFFGILWSSFKEKNVATFLTIGIFFALASFNFVDFLGLVVAGFWLAVLRTQTVNIWAPVFSIIGMDISSELFKSFLGRVDITGVQTYSDINTTYLFASIPSVFLGIVLLMYLTRILSDFHFSYSVKDFGISIKEFTNKNSVLSVIKSFKPTYVVAVIIFVVLWILTIKGVML